VERAARFDTVPVKVVITVLIAVALVALGLSLPWTTGGRALPPITTDNRSLSANFNWTSHWDSAPDYTFAPESVTSDFTAVGSSVASFLNLNATGWIDGGFGGGWIGGFSVSITGAVVPGLDPTGVRFVLVESPNSTLQVPVVIWPGSGPQENISNIDTAWTAQGNNGSTTQTGGAGSAALQVDLENQTLGPTSQGSPSYHFEMSLGPQLELGTFQDGQTTLSLFAILQGLSQLVYCAMTIQVQQILV
jgi:hypothetical protein